MVQETKLWVNANLNTSESTVQTAVNIILTASGLTENVAKTCVYYAIGTYGLEQLTLYPLLSINGAAGTGKSSAMKALEKLVCKPVKMGTKLTNASLRDKLNTAREATAFVEEGDTADEEYIANRYSRETSKSSVKRGSNAGWTDTIVDYFGATILHKRKPFNDPATDSRSIVIKTRPHPDKQYSLLEVDESLRERLKTLWQSAVPVFRKMEISGRAADVWKPLMAVATVCGDKEWLDYANSELTKAAEKLRLGQDFESEAMVVDAVIALSHKKEDTLVPLVDVKEELRRETNWQPTSWAIASMLRELGFDLKKSHGQQKVVINKIQLANIAEANGIEGAFEEIIGISIRNLE